MTVYSLVDRKLALGLKWLAPGAIPAGAGAGRKARELAHMKPPPVGFVQLETAGGTQLGATIDKTISVCRVPRRGSPRHSIRRFWSKAWPKICTGFAQSKMARCSPQETWLAERI